MLIFLDQKPVKLPFNGSGFPTPSNGVSSKSKKIFSSFLILAWLPDL